MFTVDFVVVINPSFWLIDLQNVTESTETRCVLFRVFQILVRTLSIHGVSCDHSWCVM